MKCEICGKEILRDSQCINYKYYHNDCIENLQQESKQLKEKLNCDLQWAFKYDKQLDNWNILKEFIDTLWLDDKGIVTKIKDKIELIEQGDSNVKD